MNITVKEFLSFVKVETRGIYINHHTYYYIYDDELIENVVVCDDGTINITTK